MGGLLAGILLLLSSAQSDMPDVRVEPFADNVWIRTSYTQFDNGRWVFTNGLIVRTDEGLVLIDTAWTDAQTGQVLDWVESELGEPISAAILTHAHHDKMGGVGMLHSRHVQTWAHSVSYTHLTLPTKA